MTAWTIEGILGFLFALKLFKGTDSYGGGSAGSAGAAPELGLDPLWLLPGLALAGIAILLARRATR